MSRLLDVITGADRMGDAATWAYIQEGTEAYYEQAEPIVIPTSRPDLVLSQLATYEDDFAYASAVQANRLHLSRYGDETAMKYPDVATVINARFEPHNQDRLRMGLWYQGAFAGSVNLTPHHDWPEAVTVGYWLDERFTGRGLMTEGLFALVEYAEASGVRHFFADVIDQNEASAAVLERVGFVHSSTAVDEYTGFSTRLYRLSVDDGWDEEIT